MKKWIIILLLIPLVEGYTLENDNYELNIGIVTGKNLSNDNYKLDINAYSIQSDLSTASYKLSLGYLMNWLVVSVEEEVIPEGGEGGGATYQYQPRKLTLVMAYYDFIIDNIKSTYSSEDIIYPIFTIINKGDLPDRDAILIYYLVSPSGETIGETREVFEEIPPTCPNATYNRFEDICKFGNTTFTPVKTVLEREIALPLNTDKGQWKIQVDYKTEVQPTIRVYKTFRVGFARLSFMALLVIVTTICYVGKPKKRKE